MIPIRDLFETHLTTSDLTRSVAFYRDVLGLPLAMLLPERHVAFFWIGAPGKAMLGVWETGTAPQRMSLHTAFTVDLEAMLEAPAKLQAAGVTPLDFYSKPAREPVVLAWMPAASLYFHDPDGNLLEFLCMLPDQPRPEAGVVKWTEWQRLRDRAPAGRER
jgi:lactoylglutathione lyase